MSSQTVVDRIIEFNQGRDPELLKLKYKAMSKDAFVFLRGTCHLFYQDLPVEGVFRSAPPVWSCGDLHLQNFGTFKGDDRLVYFDVNDFDESLLAPCTWDISRLIISTIVGAHALNISDEDAIELCQYFLEIYTKELSSGKDRTIHNEVSTGLVKELLTQLKTRKRKDFLDERTELKGKQRSLKLIDGKTTPATEDQRQRVKDAIAKYAESQENLKFYTVLDVMHRIAGTGSLGLDRYVILVEGNGSPNQNYLLDLKASRSSSLRPYTPYPQPNWSNEAERITAIQDRFQESPPALLTPLVIQNQPYVLRELQPTADRVNLESKDGKIKRLKKVIKTMAEVTAWGQMRSTGRQKSAIADDLIEFAATAPEWHSEVMEYARSYAAQVERDYQAFKTQLGK
ncbi:DUF2252 domain-containing protein [Leptolyngbya sp. NIES-2104]|uniref:DUF2252 domain-containing protein n=1 Tax=Leptolyngbya sp. NIES-2104 TaxID=1552121 RepID=UPI0006EC79DA|nr:DUF2252 domain-containing protein [Leptolyngbya sp. NIES-2104]GAP96460.1 uncharacterized protein conserved in bacteria [Leptolyngbya sp. NIES-2104]